MSAIRYLLAKYLPKGGFARNVGILASGTVFAQILMATALPVLTRLYAPEDFSVLAVFVATTSLFTVIANLRYNLAIPLPESNADAMALLAGAIAAALGVTTICAVIVLLAPEFTIKLIGQPGLGPYLWMIPLSILIASIYNALQYWASRQKRFKLVTRTRITRSIGGVSGQLGLGLASTGPMGLLFGQLLSEGMGIIALLRDLIRNDSETARQITWNKVKEQLHRYRRFPLFSGPEAIFDTASTQVPMIIIAIYATGAEAGFLFLAIRLLGMPSRIIGASVAQVFLVEAPGKLRDGGLYALTLKTVKYLLLIGFPPMMLAAVLAPPLFPVIFGPDWAKAGWLVVWMAPSFLLQFAVSPVSSLLHVMGLMHLAMYLHGFSLLIRVGSVYVMALYASNFISEAYAIASTVVNLLFIAVVLAVVRNTRHIKETI